MNKTLVYGIAGGLLGALSGVVVKKGIEVFKEAKKAVMDEIERARGTANPVDITPAFQEVFREENEYGGYSISKSDEHKNVYLFDFESMHPEIDEKEPELRYEETDDLSFDDEPVEPTWKEKKEWDDRLRKVLRREGMFDYSHTLYMYDAHGTEREDLEDMRYDMNSNEALQQYKAMKLADVQRGEWWDILYRFFDVKFEPDNEMDDNIKISIEADREEFFGLESIHTVGQATIAEVILHFAELMSLDFGESVDYYAEELVANIDIRRDADLNEYVKVGWLLTHHDLYTKHGYGIFGLTVVQQSEMNHETLFEEYNRSSYFDELD